MSSDLARNITWPGWETVRLIGRGSFGAVYEIQREVFGETERAALKVISIPQNEGDIDEMYSDGHDDESITKIINGHMESVVAEYTLMRKMNGCTNIVNCEDIRYVQHDDGIGWDLFIKMELLTPLTKALDQYVPEETVINIGQDICNALIICKQHRIIHRDIKPQNIFVSPYGDYKLGDFGIAKTVEKTMGGTKIGTYKYMAPEVYNNQAYGSAADIYSLGLVLYWLLNERRLPFLPLPPQKIGAGMEEKAREMRLAGEELPLPKHGSSELKAIVMKACAYDPRDRFRSAAEMLDALEEIGTVQNTAIQLETEQWLDEEDMTISPGRTQAERPRGKHQQQKPQKPQRARKPRPRKMLRWIILADCTLLIVALVLWAGLVKNRLEPEPTPTSAPIISPTPTPVPMPEPTPTPVPTPAYRVIDVASDQYQTAFLKSDGTVTAIGNNYQGECNVQDWTNIVEVAAGCGFTLGLKSDGTVVAVGYDEYAQVTKANSWNDIRISAVKEDALD